MRIASSQQPQMRYVDVLFVCAVVLACCSADAALVKVVSLQLDRHTQAFPWAYFENGSTLECACGIAFRVRVRTSAKVARCGALNAHTSPVELLHTHTHKVQRLALDQIRDNYIESPNDYGSVKTVSFRVPAKAIFAVHGAVLGEVFFRFLARYDRPECNLQLRDWSRYQSLHIAQDYAPTVRLVVSDKASRFQQDSTHQDLVVVTVQIQDVDVFNRNDDPFEYAAISLANVSLDGAVAELFGSSSPYGEPSWLTPIEIAVGNASWWQKETEIVNEAHVFVQYKFSLTALREAIDVRLNKPNMFGVYFNAVSSLDAMVNITLNVVATSGRTNPQTHSETLHFALSAAAKSSKLAAHPASVKRRAQKRRLHALNKQQRRPVAFSFHKQFFAITSRSNASISACLDAFEFDAVVLIKKMTMTVNNNPLKSASDVLNASDTTRSMTPNSPLTSVGASHKSSTTETMNSATFEQASTTALRTDVAASKMSSQPSAISNWTSDGNDDEQLIAETTASHPNFTTSIIANNTAGLSTMHKNVQTTAENATKGQHNATQNSAASESSVKTKTTTSLRSQPSAFNNSIKHDDEQLVANTATHPSFTTTNKTEESTERSSTLTPQTMEIVEHLSTSQFISKASKASIGEEVHTTSDIYASSGEGGDSNSAENETLSSTTTSTLTSVVQSLKPLNTSTNDAVQKYVKTTAASHQRRLQTASNLINETLLNTTKSAPQLSAQPSAVSNRTSDQQVMATTSLHPSFTTNTNAEEPTNRSSIPIYQENDIIEHFSTSPFITKASLASIGEEVHTTSDIYASSGEGGDSNSAENKTISTITSTLTSDFESLKPLNTSTNDAVQENVKSTSASHHSSPQEAVSNSVVETQLNTTKSTPRLSSLQPSALSNWTRDELLITNTSAAHPASKLRSTLTFQTIETDEPLRTSQPISEASPRSSGEQVRTTSGIKLHSTVDSVPQSPTTKLNLTSDSTSAYILNSSKPNAETNDTVQEIIATAASHLGASQESAASISIDETHLTNTNVSSLPSAFSNSTDYEDEQVIANTSATNPSFTTTKKTEESTERSSTLTAQTMEIVEHLSTSQFISKASVASIGEQVHTTSDIYASSGEGEDSDSAENETLSSTITSTLTSDFESLKPLNTSTNDEVQEDVMTTAAFHHSLPPEAASNSVVETQLNTTRSTLSLNSLQPSALSNWTSEGHVLTNTSASHHSFTTTTTGDKQSSKVTTVQENVMTTTSASHPNFSQEGAVSNSMYETQITNTSLAPGLSFQPSAASNWTSDHQLIANTSASHPSFTTTKNAEKDSSKRSATLTSNKAIPEESGEEMHTTPGSYSSSSEDSSFSVSKSPGLNSTSTSTSASNFTPNTETNITVQGNIKTATTASQLGSLRHTDETNRKKLPTTSILDNLLPSTLAHGKAGEFTHGTSTMQPSVPTDKTVAEKERASGSAPASLDSSWPSTPQNVTASSSQPIPVASTTANRTVEEQSTNSKAPSEESSAATTVSTSGPLAEESPASATPRDHLFATMSASSKRFRQTSVAEATVESTGFSVSSQSVGFSSTLHPEAPTESEGTQEAELDTTTLTLLATSTRLAPTRRTIRGKRSSFRVTTATRQSSSPSSLKSDSETNFIVQENVETVAAASHLSSSRMTAEKNRQKLSPTSFLDVLLSSTSTHGKAKEFSHDTLLATSTRVAPTRITIRGKRSSFRVTTATRPHSVPSSSPSSSQSSLLPAGITEATVQKRGDLTSPSINVNATTRSIFSLFGVLVLIALALVKRLQRLCQGIVEKFPLIQKIKHLFAKHALRASQSIWLTNNNT